MAVGGGSEGPLNGDGEDVSGLRFEVSRLKELLQIKEGELEAVAAKLHATESQVNDLSEKLEDKARTLDEAIATQASGREGRDERAEGEVEGMRQELESTRKKLGALQKEVECLRGEIQDYDSTSADRDEELRRLNRNVLSSSNDNRQLRQKVKELMKEREAYMEKAKSMDAKLMHLAAEAELTRMGHKEPSDGWGTGSVVLLSIAAAAGGGILVSCLKRTSS